MRPRSGGGLGWALFRSGVLSSLCSFPNGLPEFLLRQALPFLNALSGAIEQRLKARRTPQHDPLQIVVIVGSQQYGNGLAIASDDYRALGAALVHIGAQTRLHIR